MAIVAGIGVGLAKAAGFIIARVFTEKVICKVIILLLKRLAKSTKNTIDDTIIAEVEKALQ